MDEAAVAAGYNVMFFQSNETMNVRSLISSPSSTAGRWCADLHTKGIKVQSYQAITGERHTRGIFDAPVKKLNRQVIVDDFEVL